jgi:hypothetical protein
MARLGAFIPRLLRLNRTSRQLCVGIGGITPAMKLNQYQMAA